MFHPRARSRIPDRLTVLVYELLDAHDDTARLARDLELDEYWEAHLSYLRDLQRRGRESLARESDNAGQEVRSQWE
jgi:hypothetical protein